MKKYVKPELFYEQFEVSQHIASCSGEQLDFGSTETCSVKDGPFAGFFCGSHCSTDVTGVEIEDYCYTNGEDGMSLFTS